MTEVPKFVVSLDVPPERRWNHIIDIYKDRMDYVVKEIDRYFIAFFGSYLGWFMQYISTTVASILNKKEWVLYSKELNGISQRSGIPIGKIVIMQLAYEMFSHCTSIVTKTDEGVVHIRTMDWDLKILEKMTISVIFTRNGNELFKCITWPGYVGIFTAMKKDIGSIALNYRRTNDGIMQNIRKIFRWKWPAGFLIRNLLEKDITYSTLVHYLSTSELVSPCYITVAAALPENRSYLITRDRENEVNRFCLEKHGDIVQTNIDHWLGDDVPENILYSKERCYVARNKIIPKIKNNKVSIKDIHNLCQEFPIRNEETIYLTIFYPGKNEMTSWI